MPTKKTLNSAALFFDKQKYQTKSPETELKIHRHKKDVCLSYSPPRPRPFFLTFYIEEDLLNRCYLLRSTPLQKARMSRFKCTSVQVFGV